MPELPETETIAADLDRLLRGAVIRSTAVIRGDVLRTPRSSFVERLRGREITRVWRRAKTVVLDAGPLHILVTPRFTGALLLTTVSAPPDVYETIRWTLSGGRVLAYRDVRRLGTVHLLAGPAFDAFIARWGPEPLAPGFTAEALSGILRSSSRPVKVVLMDPMRIAGIGNIYANEALWAAGIDPSLRARDISPERVERLHLELRCILARAVLARGTTFRDYRDPRGASGSYAAQLRVYGRAGEPCRRCGQRLTETHAVDGRGTVFCHQCQR